MKVSQTDSNHVVTKIFWPTFSANVWR